MKSTVSQQVDTDTLLRLMSHLKVRGGAQDVEAAITSAIELWLREQSQLAKGADPASVRGYQLKTLFLPEGTEIRSWSYGEHNYARVVGDEIIHQGRAVTPNQFAQSFARSMRNAWMDLYVRRPEDRQFHLAHRLRVELARQAKQPPTDTAPAPQPQPQPESQPQPQPQSTLGALLAILQSPLPERPPPAPTPAPPPAAPRNIPPGQGWDLPERRKLRFRLEDVAY